MAERLRVLLDESIPERLRAAFSDAVEVVTVRYQGWAGLKNGALLRTAEESFDVLVTVDKGLKYQQNVGERQIAVVVLDAGGTTFADLLPLISDAEAVALRSRPGSVTVVAG